MEAEAREGWGEGDGSFAGEVGAGESDEETGEGGKKKRKARQMEKAKGVE